MEFFSVEQHIVAVFKGKGGTVSHPTLQALILTRVAPARLGSRVAGHAEEIATSDSRIQAIAVVVDCTGKCHRFSSGQGICSGACPGACTCPYINVLADRRCMVVLPALTRNALLELRLGEDVDGLACTLAASFGCLVNAPDSGCSQKECAAAPDRQPDRYPWRPCRRGACSNGDCSPT